MSATGHIINPLDDLAAVTRGIAKITGKIELSRQAGTLSPREERRLDQERRSLQNRASAIKQDLFLAASFFVAGALDALMSGAERAMRDGAALITPASDSTDDCARACFDRAGRRAAARHLTLSRLTDRTELRKAA